MRQQTQLYFKKKRKVLGWEVREGEKEGGKKKKEMDRQNFNSPGNKRLPALLHPMQAKSTGPSCCPPKRTLYSPSWL